MGLSIIKAMLPACTNATACSCQYNSQVGYDTCSCEIYRDPYYLCNRTIFEVYNNLDLIYPSLGLLLYMILLFGYLFEFVIDAKKRKMSPILLTKGAIIVFILAREVTFPLWFASSLQRSTAYARVTTFINSIGSLVLISSLMLIVVSWLDLVLIARNLGDQDRHMRRVKLSLFILTGIISPINLIMLFVTQFLPDVSVLKLVLGAAVLLLILLILASIIISIVYLVVVLRWVNGVDSPSRTLCKIRVKSYWVIALLSSLFGAAIVMIVVQVSPHDTPMAFLAIEISNRVIEVLIVILMFFFLERSSVRFMQRGKLIASTKDS